ncbi:MAG: DCL family protein [Nostocaceae cyanobacterium]|nr:DCL family protein [Nostocaceae cyanobacterium]
MAKRKKIQILDKEFESQEKLKEYTRQILHKYNLNQELSLEDFRFMIALIKRGHPDAHEKIGDGIEMMWIQENKVNRGTTRGFAFKRIDSSTDNFSYITCIEKHPTLTSHFIMACREAVDFSVNKYREEAFKNTETLICPITSELITLREAYVAHSSPSFKKLTEDFKRIETLVISEQLFKTHGDGDFTMSFANEENRRKWTIFWHENANLEIRSKNIQGQKHD